MKLIYQSRSKHDNRWELAPQLYFNAYHHRYREITLWIAECPGNIDVCRPPLVTRRMPYDKAFWQRLLEDPLAVAMEILL